MQFARPVFATHPMAFGRRGAQPAPAPEQTVSNDLRLFATTFAAGFLFVTVLIA